MPILNKQNYSFILSFNDRNSIPPPVQHYDHGGEPVTKLYNWETKNYWLVEFINGDAFYHYPIEKIAPSEIYNGIKNGNIILLISHITEAYHYVIEDIYKDLIIEQCIPIENILFLTNSADIEKEIEIISKKYNLPKLKSAFMVTFEYGAKGDLNRYPIEFDTNTLEDKIYEKKFLSLNGLWRPHRLLLVSYLKSLNLIESGFVSLNSVPGDYPTMDSTFNQMIKWSEHNPEGKQVLLDNEIEIKKLDKLFIENDNINIPKAAFTSLNKSFYENSYFSIITESICWSTGSGEGNTLGRTLSEKTFKAILYKHPFLLLAVPGTLKLLHSLGYKTFSELIDESYDNEYDDSKRVYMVAKEAEKLCNLKSADLSFFLKRCREITEYNFSVLKNKQNFLYFKT